MKNKLESKQDKELTQISKEEFIRGTQNMIDFYACKLAESENILASLQVAENYGDLIIKFFIDDDGNLIMETYEKPPLGFARPNANRSSK